MGLGKDAVRISLGTVGKGRLTVCVQRPKEEISATHGHRRWWQVKWGVGGSGVWQDVGGTAAGPRGR